MFQEHFPQPDSFTEEKQSEYASRFTVGALYPGYGRTIGNTLRRVLLSSLPGIAITSVKLEGVQHEFSTLPGVKEDVVDILLNLKNIFLRSDAALGDEPVKLRLVAEGARSVMAGDFEKRAGITVMNPRLHVATLTDETSTFDMTVTLGQGRGYDPIESRTTRIKEISVIELDATYSPVRAVGYAVENVRVGQMTNWDRLTFTIETNGVLTPYEALREATKILEDEITAVKNLVEAKQQEEKVDKKSEASEA